MAKKSLSNHISLIEVLIVLFGIVIAAILRWKIDNILIVNVIGCLIFGYLIALPSRSKYPALLRIGFCATCTTFSGLTFSSLNYIYSGLWKQGLELILSNYIFGLCALFVGFLMSRRIN